MKRMTGRRTAGFTLIEILVVVAVVGILASILIPVAGRAAKGSKKRKAQVEVSSLKMAVEQFHQDHHYMPFKNTGGKKGMVGEDKWAQTDDSDWMEMLQGENALKKNYFTAKTDDTGKFLDPWGHAYYVGMDRNQDGYVEGTGDVGGAGKIARDIVGVYSLGEDGQKATTDDIATFSWEDKK